jgi:hypothetical protein
LQRFEAIHQALVSKLNGLSTRDSG